MGLFVFFVQMHLGNYIVLMSLWWDFEQKLEDSSGLHRLFAVLKRFKHCNRFNWFAKAFIIYSVPSNSFYLKIQIISRNRVTEP